MSLVDSIELNNFQSSYNIENKKMIIKFSFRFYSNCIFVLSVNWYVYFYHIDDLMHQLTMFKYRIACFLLKMKILSLFGSSKLIVFLCFIGAAIEVAMVVEIGAETILALIDGIIIVGIAHAHTRALSLNVLCTLNCGLRDLLFQLAGFLNWMLRGRLFTYFEQDLFAPAFSVISWWVLIFSQGLI
jgi:hypothetical protein